MASDLRLPWESLWALAPEGSRAAAKAVVAAEPCRGQRLWLGLQARFSVSLVAWLRRGPRGSPLPMPRPPS